MSTSTYTVYELATGKITRKVTCSDLRELEHNLFAHEYAVRGSYSASRYLIINGEPFLKEQQNANPDPAV